MSTGPGGRRNKRRRDRVRLKEGSRIREPGSTDPEAVPFNDNENVAPSSGEAENKPSKPSAMLGLSSAFNLVTKLSDKMTKQNKGKKCFEYIRISRNLAAQQQCQHSNQWNEIVEELSSKA